MKKLIAIFMTAMAMVMLNTAAIAKTPETAKRATAQQLPAGAMTTASCGIFDTCINITNRSYYPIEIYINEPYAYFNGDLYPNYMQSLVWYNVYYSSVYVELYDAYDHYYLWSGYVPNHGDLTYNPRTMNVTRK